MNPDLTDEQRDLLRVIAERLTKSDDALVSELRETYSPDNAMVAAAALANQHIAIAVGYLTGLRDKDFAARILHQRAEEIVAPPPPPPRPKLTLVASN